MEQKILITGANGFIGKNLKAELRNRGYQTIYECDQETTEEELEAYTSSCTFVFHLAGINRPKDEKEFKEGNCDFTEKLTGLLSKAGNRATILMSSSIQAALDNPYGNSKREAEKLLQAHEAQTGGKVLIYRLPGVFGKWCRPNYNSVVATFCHNIAHGQDIEIHDESRQIELVYIDDVIASFLEAMDGKVTKEGDFCRVPVTHTVTLKALADTIRSFPAMRKDLFLPDLSDALTGKLYSTYLSYLPEDAFSYPLQKKEDERGSFTEFLKSDDRGQVSVNVAKCGITKGNHWHHSKNEKFLVVSGEACIRFRKIGDDKVITYHVSGKDLTVVDIPTGYTHNITNVGDTDLITIMWASEPFDANRPDTYYEQVQEESSQEDDQ